MPVDQIQITLSDAKKDVKTPLVQFPQNVSTETVSTNGGGQVGKVGTRGKKRLPPGEFLRRCAHTYIASLLGTFVAVPIAASAVTAGFYFSNPGAQDTLIVGALVTYGAWLIVAAFCSYFATVQGANSRSYGLIKCRMDQLKSRLGIVDGPDGRPQPMTLEEMIKAAEVENCAECNLFSLKEANIIYRDLYDMLWGSSGLEWALATGYINVWTMINRAEEALIEVEPAHDIIRGAIHDALAIRGSTIGSREELLNKLMLAIKALDPLATDYFSVDKKQEIVLQGLMQETQQNTKLLAQLVQAVKKLDPSTTLEDVEKIVPIDSVLAVGAGSPEIHIRARAVLREVRSTLNSFRDSLWEGLIRARNHLLGAIVVTGIVTHVLLCIAILTGQDGGLAQLIAAVVFYIVGAIAGLFGRFYREISGSAAVDDYGLSLARLIATPLLSGLSGVGGVLITALLYTTLSASPSVTMSGIFRLDEPRYILAAAIFGLTPNLIIRSLQQKAERYVSDLQSSKGADSGDA